MLARVRRKLRKKLSGFKNNEVNDNKLIDNDKPFVVDEDVIVIKKDNLGESMPYISELAGKEEKLIPRRKITTLKWNGPIMTIEGYFYLENIPMQDEDLVKKRLLLIDEKGKKIIISMKDKPVNGIGESDIDEYFYKWAAFESEINFATLDANNKPLPESDYKLYIEIEVHELGNKRYRKVVPLGNVEPLLEEGFHSAKMEYFTSSREMKFNLLATYDLSTKTLKIISTKLKDMDPRLMDLDNNLDRTGLLYRFFSTVGFRILYNFFCLFPLKQSKVIFASDSRTELSGNFIYVYEEMLKKNLPLDYHFMLKKGVGEKKEIKELINLAYHLATSKFILLDDFYPMIYPLRIRKNAELIQLWHAVGAFKTFGFSRVGRPGGPSPKSINHRNYTKAIVSSKHVAKHYAEGFGIDEEKVIPTGIPRTDIFFDENYKSEVRERLYQEYPFLKEKKVITFAPTFRGNGQQSAHYPIEVLDLDRLYRELRDEYIFIFKIHPFVKNDINIPYQYRDFFYDFSSYREINDLLFVTDILITDYSSTCFEFALLNRPMIFFAFDIEEYVQKRDFYYEYSSFIPGPLVKNTEKLIETINNKDFKMEKIDPFVHYFFDDHDGKSSERVVDQLILSENENKNG